MVQDQVYDLLKQLIPEFKLKQNESLANYTFTKVGGSADTLAFPTTFSEVQALVRFANDHQIPLTILGNASNVIIREGGIRGIVLNLTKMDQWSLEGDRLICQSGVPIIIASRQAHEHRLTGLEFACGIPGSTGGAVFMNAGAYGGEIADVLESVQVVTPTGELVRIPASDLALRYRGSIIPDKQYIVVEATFKLTPGDPIAIRTKMDELTYLRESKQPLEYPSCGSVFKRPPGYFAGKLIQDSGLQGTQIGGVQVSEKHSGFMVNKGTATSTDYLNLIQLVQQTVKQKFGVDLEPEVKIIGDEPLNLPRPTPSNKEKAK